MPSDIAMMDEIVKPKFELRCPKCMARLVSNRVTVGENELLFECCGYILRRESAPPALVIDPAALDAGYNYLSDETYTAIEAMLREGNKPSKIADKIGVSVSVVQDRRARLEREGISLEATYVRLCASKIVELRKMILAGRDDNEIMATFGIGRTKLQWHRRKMSKAGLVTVVLQKRGPKGKRSHHARKAAPDERGAAPDQP